MRCYIWAVFAVCLLAGVLLFPQPVSAGMELRVYSEADNMIGEVWLDESVWLRIGIIPSGAVQASGGGSPFDLILVPELSRGFFAVRLQ